MLEVTDDLAGCKLDGSAIVFEESDEDIEGHVVGNPSGSLNKAEAAAAANMPDVEFDVEDAVDGEKAQDYARSIKIDFEPSDIKFWFSQLEGEMVMATIRSAWLKRTVLQRNLPIKQRSDVKAYLTLTKAEGGATIYKDIKDELIRIYAPKPEDSYCRALSRVLVGLPSQLGAQLIDDVCKKAKKFDNCCCAGHVHALWSQKLPVNVRAHISNMPFTKDTYKEVFQAADKVFLAAKQVSVAAFGHASQSAEGAAATQGLDETLPAFLSHNQEVAAFGQSNKNNKGQGQSQKNKNKGQNGQNNKNKNNKGHVNTGQRHSSNPPDGVCSRHFRHGDTSWFCTAPLTCPWASKLAPRP